MMRAAAVSTAAALAFCLAQGLHAPGRVAVAAEMRSVADAYPGAPILAQPDLDRLRRAGAAAARAGRRDEALAAADAIEARAPAAPAAAALRAEAYAASQDAEKAVAALVEAARRGYPEIDALIAAPAFAPLRADPRLAALDSAPTPTRSVAPALGANGRVEVGAGNLRWRADLAILEALVDVRPPPSVARGPAIAETTATPAGDLWRALRRDGGAAGNVGDLYDNRDRGHSRLDLRRFPQMTAVAYGQDLRAAGMDTGFNDKLTFSRPTVGNASLAVTAGAAWRSLPRLAMFSEPALAAAIAQYRANQIYVYPANNDVRTDRGDVFPANTPYMLISRGASGSDLPLASAVVAAWSALRPDAKARLVELGLLAPATQMILRRAMAGDDAAYLTGAAHPTAFDGAAVDQAAVMRVASAIAADALPPVAQLRVAIEPALTPGVDMFGDGLSERLFDTPGAVARVARGAEGRRRYVLDAGGSFEADGRPLRYAWRLLRGDPARTTIRPLSADGRTVEIVADWPDAPSWPGPDGVASSRVDVGLFVRAEGPWSAPAFFSLTFPAHQARRYDAEGRPLSIDHADPAKRGTYVDPALYPLRNWRDVFHYGPDGRLTGWTRRRNGAETRFTATGLRVLAEDALGRPIRAETVRYPLRRDTDGRPVVEEVAVGAVTIDYAGPEDRRGVARPGGP